MAANQDFQYDVFLTHNQADKPRVWRLAERLRAAGLRQSNFALRTANFGLGTLCLSPAALGSDWVGLERSTVLFRDPANASRRIIPLLLTDCRPSRPAKTACRTSTARNAFTRRLCRVERQANR